MSQLSSTIVTASYQILGTTTPGEWMAHAFKVAVNEGLIEAGRVTKLFPIHGSTDFFVIVFDVEVGLDRAQRLGDLFADAKAITDRLVADTDTVIENIEFSDRTLKTS